jgi:hypothetical protein
MPDDLHTAPTQTVFRAAFGREAQQKRLEERERQQREREQLEALNARREHFARLREGRG